jgi:hypothetical protein
VTPDELRDLAISWIIGGDRSASDALRSAMRSGELILELRQESMHLHLQERPRGWSTAPPGPQSSG